MPSAPVGIRILIIDIETAPHKVYSWGLYDQDIAINQIEEPGYTLCYAAKWYGEREILFDSVHRSSPRKMVEGAHELLSDADAVIHFNGAKFDIPTLNKEFILHGLNPPPPFKQIDLLKTCRGKFKWASNKLDYVAQSLGVGAKVHNKGMDLWRACMEPKHAGHETAWRTMERYNKGDVRLTERLYKRLLPWIDNHPNVGLYNGKKHVCPKCSSDNLISNGFRFLAMHKYRRYQCLDCGNWSRERVISGASKGPTLV